MTTLLKKAIKKLENLPKRRQDSYASIIMSELDSEVWWNGLFARTSVAKIKKMEKMARDDVRKGTLSLNKFLGV